MKELLQSSAWYLKMNHIYTCCKSKEKEEWYLVMLSEWMTIEEAKL